MAAEKTTATRVVEGILTTMLGSVVENAQKGLPPVKLSEEGEPITPRSILAQIEKNIDAEPKVAMRLGMTLGAIIARQQGVAEKEALSCAALAWAQTSNLTPR
ncbi:MAG: hypothetical protein WC977_02030 [Anaerovoracaceae bacterium]|jgi:hypothetical protein